jgi:3-methylcrotonyl-CoA carboxylase alpha subunit
MEARIYAEEPGRGFLPATGHLVHLRFPINSKHIRIDTGVRQGDAITIHYDPMIAKLIVWDKDRKSCLKRMQAALGDTQIVGLATNIDFLSSVVSHPSFKKGQVNTGFIDRYRDELLLGGNPASESIIALATLYILVEHQKLMQEVAAQSNDPYSPWHLVNGWQMNLNSFKKVFFCDNNREYEAIIHYTTKAITIRVGDKSFSVSGLIDEQGDLAATLNDTHVHVTVVRQGSLLTLLHGGSSYQMTFIDKTVPDTQKESSPGGLMSPMPGRVLAILVNEQAKVKKGTPLMVIEAMKMEHTISAPVGGVVSAIYYPVGALIGEGVELLRLDGEDLPEDTFREL